jgi:hypothetical protein
MSAATVTPAPPRRGVPGRRRLPAWARWGGAGLLFVLAALAVWFFFFRQDGPLPTPPAPPARPALGRAVPLADYRGAVDDALAEVRDARNAGGTEREQAIERAIRHLESVEGAGVAPPGRQGAPPAQVDNTAVLAELQSDEPNLDAAESALTALSGALSAGPSPPVEGTLQGSAATDALAEVLADVEFDYTRDESPIQRLARWLAQLSGDADPGDTLWSWVLSVMAGVAVGTLTYLLLGKYVQNRWARLGLSVMAGLVGGPLFLLMLRELDITFQVLGVIGLVVAAVAVGLFAAGLFRGAAPPSPRPMSELAEVLGMSAAEARGKAAGSAAEGDYRSALRFRCLAVLLALDEAGMLAFDRAATNREYLVRAPRPIHDELQPLLDRFDAVWYGNSPTSAQEWETYSRRAETVEREVAAHAQTQGKAA